MQRNEAICMKGKTLRRLLIVLLALVFLGSAGMLVYTRFQYREGDSAYAEAEELVELPDLTELRKEPEPAPEEPAEVQPEEPNQQEMPQQEPVYVAPMRTPCGT